MAVPQKELVPWGRVSGRTGPDSGYAIAFNGTANSDEIRVLSSLKEQVTSGEYGLDAMLAAIADAARRLTGASGTALAMWKNGAMVCRARSGQTAPPLGAQLSADTGISGECLRTGQRQHCSDTENNPLVDVEVCRSLGLRSIAVLPIQGWRAVNGILEAFATAPDAFSEHHLALLEELAALAERARASRPHGALPVVAKLPLERLEPSGLLPASDRLRDFVLGLVGRQSRPLVLGAVVLAAMLLFGFAVWLGWRGPRESDGKTRAAAPSSATTALARLSAGQVAGTRLVGTGLANGPLTNRRLPDNDPVWKLNPGGETLLPSGAKPSAGSPVKGASKAGVAERKEERSLLAADEVGVAVPHRAPETGSGLEIKPQGSAPAEQGIAVEPPPISVGQSNSPALDGILSAKATLPGLSAPVSRGITGGQLVRRVAPVYPSQAKNMRLEGKVVLNAMVAEDGSVSDLKVVAGQRTLAQAATDAVKQWRYQPFTLNGKPVKREITLTIDFKLP